MDRGEIEKERKERRERNERYFIFARAPSEFCYHGLFSHIKQLLIYEKKMRRNKREILYGGRGIKDAI
jgi:hypothetical protein